MPRTRSFTQVDVFSMSPYSGNPVAVVLDGTDVTDEEMQRLARWTNLSETTFVLPPTTPEADYRLRIFTPQGELPFAGHPTLGSARAWLDDGGTPQDPDRIVQECAAGLVTVRRGEDALSFAAPPRVRDGALDDDYLNQIVAAFGITYDRVLAHQWVTTDQAGQWSNCPQPRRSWPSNPTSPSSRPRWSVRSGPTPTDPHTTSRCAPLPRAPECPRTRRAAA
jgi:PhzF family phenazine biosynthesis protein